MMVGCKLLDLGDIEKIDWVDPEGDGNWKIRVVGTKGAWAYNPVVVMSRDCFEDGGVQLWDVRLECLRREWITKSGKGQWELHPEDKIRVPHISKRDGCDPRQLATMAPSVDFAAAIMKSIEEIRFSRSENYGKCVSVPKKFNPFRYPGTSITEHDL